MGIGGPPKPWYFPVFFILYILCRKGCQTRQTWSQHSNTQKESASFVTQVCQEAHELSIQLSRVGRQLSSRGVTKNNRRTCLFLICSSHTFINDTWGIWRYLIQFYNVSAYSCREISIWVKSKLPHLNSILDGHFVGKYRIWEGLGNPRPHWFDIRWLLSPVIKLITARILDGYSNHL